MRSPPPDLLTERLREVLSEGWGLRVRSMKYVPEGGGSHHWKVVDEGGQSRFVTVDDLDDKDWMADTRSAVFEGLCRALNTAAALRHVASLDFVVAPIPAGDGEALRRLDNRYTVSVFPYLTGRSYPFGLYPDAGLRDLALDMVAALHQATPAVRDCAPHHELGFGGRRDLNAFLGEPDRPWNGGPFSDPARALFMSCAADLVQLVRDFDRLVVLTATARDDPVITHGEPHPANLMTVEDRLVLVDWDTAALGPRERDLSLIATAGGDDFTRYREATGWEVDPAVVTLYRLRWYLDDLASAVRLFRNDHRDTPDTRRSADALARQLGELPTWLNRVG